MLVYVAVQFSNQFRFWNWFIFFESGFIFLNSTVFAFLTITLSTTEYSALLLRISDTILLSNHHTYMYIINFIYSRILDFLAEASNVKEKYIKYIKYITITHYCEMFEPRSHLTT